MTQVVLENESYLKHITLGEFVEGRGGGQVMQESEWEAAGSGEEIEGRRVGNTKRLPEGRVGNGERGKEMGDIASLEGRGKEMGDIGYSGEQMFVVDNTF